jgi:hypothetical protein
MGQAKARVRKSVTEGERRAGSSFPVRLNFAADLAEAGSSLNPNDTKTLAQVRHAQLEEEPRSSLKPLEFGERSLRDPDTRPQPVEKFSAFARAVNLAAGLSENAPRKWNVSSPLKARFANLGNDVTRLRGELQDIEKAVRRGTIEAGSSEDRSKELQIAMTAAANQRLAVAKQQALIDQHRGTIEDWSEAGNRSGVVIDYDDSGNLALFEGEPYRPSMSLSAADDGPDAETPISLDRLAEWNREEQLVPQAEDTSAMDAEDRRPSAVTAEAVRNPYAGVGADLSADVEATEGLRKLRAMRVGISPRPREGVPSRADALDAAASWTAKASETWRARAPQPQAVPAVPAGAARPYAPPDPAAPRDPGYHLTASAPARPSTQRQTAMKPAPTTVDLNAARQQHLADWIARVATPKHSSRGAQIGGWTGGDSWRGGARQAGRTDQALTYTTPGEALLNAFAKARRR